MLGHLRIAKAWTGRFLKIKIISLALAVQSSSSLSFLVMGRTSQSSITKPISSFQRTKCLSRAILSEALYVTEFVKLNPDKTWNATSPSEQFMVNGVNQLLNRLSWRRDTQEFAYGPHAKDEWARSLSPTTPWPLLQSKCPTFSSG